MLIEASKSASCIEKLCFYTISKDFKRFISFGWWLRVFFKWTGIFSKFSKNFLFVLKPNKSEIKYDGALLPLCSSGFSGTAFIWASIALILSFTEIVPLFFSGELGSPLMLSTRNYGIKLFWKTKGYKRIWKFIMTNKHTQWTWRIRSIKLRKTFDSAFCG